jgi:hypothetical protein
MFLQLDSNTQAAIIAGIVAIFVAIIPVVFGYRRSQLEMRKINAEIRRIESEQDKRRKGVLNQLLDFLRILEINEKIFNTLLGGRGDLEYHPVVLRNRFRKLQQNDPKKIFWYESIKDLRFNNHQAISIIRAIYGEILTERFRSAYIDFEFHALEWERVWKAVETEAPDPDAEKTSSLIQEIELDTTKFFQQDPDDTIPMKDSLYAQRFPEGIREALEIEIEKHQKLLQKHA